MSDLPQPPTGAAQPPPPNPAVSMPAWIAKSPSAQPWMRWLIVLLAAVVIGLLAALWWYPQPTQWMRLTRWVLLIYALPALISGGLSAATGSAKVRSVVLNFAFGFLVFPALLVSVMVANRRLFRRAHISALAYREGRCQRRRAQAEGLPIDESRDRGINREAARILREIAAEIDPSEDG